MESVTNQLFLLYSACFFRVGVEDQSTLSIVVQISALRAQPKRDNEFTQCPKGLIQLLDITPWVQQVSCRRNLYSKRKWHAPGRL